MDIEKEITVEVNSSLNDLSKLLEDKGFFVKEVYDINDIYMINKNDIDGHFLSMLNKCVLIRNIIEENSQKKMLTYKHKEYNENEEIIKQGEVNLLIDDINAAKELFEGLNFKELIRIFDHMYVYSNGADEFVVQCVNDKHIYIEIEDECYYSNKKYKSIDEMKDVIIKNSIPIKNNNYFVKKAEVELRETYNK